MSELCAVISDSVNVGARLENLCKRFGVGVLASQEALDACPDPARFPHRCLGDQQLRGKARSVRIYEVFAYEDPAVVEAKLETREQFEEAVRLLSGPHGGADAFVLLRQLQRKLPDDPVTGLLLQKAAQSVTGAF